MRMMRKILTVGAAMFDALPRWRIVAGAVIYLGAALQLCHRLL
jgi:hypothetical protein